jgi:hypothetical protein
MSTAHHTCVLSNSPGCFPRAGGSNECKKWCIEGYKSGCKNGYEMGTKCVRNGTAACCLLLDSLDRFEKVIVAYGLLLLPVKLFFPHWKYPESALEMVGIRTGIDPFPHWNRLESALESFRFKCGNRQIVNLFGCAAGAKKRASTKSRALESVEAHK